MFREKQWKERALILLFIIYLCKRKRTLKEHWILVLFGKYDLDIYLQKGYRLAREPVECGITSSNSEIIIIIIIF